MIHGDASVGNVLRDRQGAPVLIDLEGFAIGPREWDLGLTAMYYDSFGWHTRQEYQGRAWQRPTPRGALGSGRHHGTATAFTGLHVIDVTSRF